MPMQDLLSKVHVNKDKKKYYIYIFIYFGRVLQLLLMIGVNISLIN